MLEDLELIAVDELKKLLRCGRTRAYAIINAGDVEAIKSGSKTLINLKSVAAYLAKCPRVGCR